MSEHEQHELDDLARYNQERWDALVAANIEYSRPMLNLDPAAARRMVDPYGVMAEVAGRDVLCLAGGGGQQSAAFALLGARVTVIDLSAAQLARDQAAAAHYGITVRTVQGDMRDLSVFAGGSFDLVWHAHSINFVPDPQRVFDEVARVLRPGGQYRLDCSNPFVHSLDERDWDGTGYPLRHPYRNGELTEIDPEWTVVDEDGTVRRVRGPREFRHTLGTLLNGLIGRGFALQGLWEEPGPANAKRFAVGDPDATPGTWEHFKSVAPPWLVMWTSYRPDILC